MRWWIPLVAALGAALVIIAAVACGFLFWRRYNRQSRERALEMGLSEVSPSAVPHAVAIPVMSYQDCCSGTCSPDTRA